MHNNNFGSRVRKLKKTPSFIFWDKNPGHFFQLGQISEKVPKPVSSKKLCFSPPLDKTAIFGRNGLLIANGNAIFMTKYKYQGFYSNIYY